MAAKNRNINQIVARWVQNGTAGATKYKDNINALVENPLQKAAASGAKYLANIQASEAAGKRAAGLEAYGFDNWKRVTTSKGALRLGQGMSESQDRYMAAMNRLLPFIDQTVANLPARGDLNMNIARAEQFMRKMATYSTRM